MATASDFIFNPPTFNVPDIVLFPLTVNPVNVPTLVKLLLITEEFNVSEVNVLAEAVMVIGAVPSKVMPLIVLPVANAVAVPALPETLPTIVFVTVKLVSVPTLVKLLVTIALGRFTPDNEFVDIFPLNTLVGIVVLQPNAVPVYVR